MLEIHTNEMISRCSRASSVLFQISSTLKAPTSSHYYHLCQPSNKKKPIFITQILIRSFSVISEMVHHIGTNSGGGGSGVARLSAVSRGGDDSSSGLVSFQIAPSSLLKIQKGDITRWSVDGSSDAIVSPANERMLGGGGADGAIHRAAGPELRDACYKVQEVRPGVRCPTGEARITRGFRLPASHVIHTVGPIYDEDRDPEASLRNAYKNSLRVAKENNIQYVAFPAISCGIYRYPLDEAASVALSAVKNYGNDLKEVHFVLFADEIYDAWFEKAKDMFID